MRTAAPLFSVGQQVITPRHVPGVVKWVFPRGKFAEPVYSVSIAKRRRTIVLDERELADPAGNTLRRTVCCRDCAHPPAPVIENVVRCPVFKRLRSMTWQRHCEHFSPRNKTEGGQK